jgi:3-hydroxyacyl-[acyl-carrier-protein] dehydratase
MNIKKILEILPHRYPILLVDRVLDNTETHITAIKNITFNEDIFNGHFPDNPIYPGVYQIEGMAQAGALLASFTIGDFSDKLIYFMSIDNAKFRQPVIPGDQLTYKVEIIKKRGNIWIFSGKCYVEDKLVSQAELKATIVQK